MREFRPILAFLAAVFFAIAGSWIAAAGFVVVLLLSIDDIRYLVRNRLRPDQTNDDPRGPQETP